MKPRVSLVAACLALLPFSVAPAGAQETIALPEGEGKKLVEVVCSQCHGIKPLFVYNADDRKWEILLHEMVAFGTQVTPQERDTIMKYLKATFSTQRTSSAKDAGHLPAGRGQEVLQASCGGCHGMPLIARKRAGRTEWEQILARHTSEERVTLSADQLQALLAYLAANFGTVESVLKPPPAQQRR